MRISDWSSDVCSSDLLQTLDAELQLCGIAGQPRVEPLLCGRTRNLQDACRDAPMQAIAVLAQVGARECLPFAVDRERDDRRQQPEHVEPVANQEVDLRSVGQWPLRLGRDFDDVGRTAEHRSEEHTSELQSLMRISYAVFCLKKK